MNNQPPIKPEACRPLPRHFRERVAQTANSILLETTFIDAANRTSYLFLNPTRILIANSLEEVQGLFVEIEQALDRGFWVAGYLSYESGYHFARLPNCTMTQPLAWFGVYDNVDIHDHGPAVPGVGQVPQSLPIEPQRRCGPVTERAVLEISEEEYTTKIGAIKEHLLSGDTYQVNFTDRVSFNSPMSAADVYTILSSRQQVAYSAFLNIGERPILSFSPELFFRTDGDLIITRPMKGTMPRGTSAAEDERIAGQLQYDEKNRSEHVMIVDLLRSDLGRICRPGSIAVEQPFAVERYATLHQMTSAVTGRLKAGTSFYEIFAALFPSGSITGAPKRRTMQIIHDLERHARGVYTGAIGFISPRGSSAFNVAIRTLVMHDGDIIMGVGGGIVADSRADDEYRECLLKAAFLTRRHQSFQLFETLLWDGEFQRLDAHLDRLASSAVYFSFSFDRSRTKAQLFELCDSTPLHKNTRQRIRLTLAANGEVTTQVYPYPQTTTNVRVWLCEERVASSDVFLRHKTSRRDLYDTLYAVARNHGFDDVIFRNERSEITEGAISNIIIEKDGELLTPPLGSGVLPGVYRGHVLATMKNSRESILVADDLLTADKVFLCNSLRGLRRATSLSASLEGESATVLMQ